ncbi:unnamed protein product [Adineta ricciae]|uniref:F-box domain-containing protein n=1 Tax=Adineta ricciae TaxID=249248 RepID=A0A814NDK7_ADIRI|nr:unnamed protein product [Adineta ricciae]CAF1091334.1 unnamed protein product [Adineta ricciae]
MNRNKRKPNLISKSNEDKDKKQRINRSCLPNTNMNRSVITHLESLSNEIIYEIFDFLHSYDIYQAFFHLNTRFRQLCIHPNLSIAITNLSSKQKSFERYFNEFVVPYLYRIRSLDLTNLFLVDLISKTTNHLSHCTQLQTVVLGELKVPYLTNILNNLSTELNLLSLTLCIDVNSNCTQIYDRVFHFPVLKYCTIHATVDNLFESLLISAKPTSPIEYLNINSSCHLNHLHICLSHVPQLRHLLVESIHTVDNVDLQDYSRDFNQLTSVVLMLKKIDFQLFATFVDKHFRRLRKLTISVPDENDHIDAEQWQYLIVSFMPCLKTFDYQLGTLSCYSNEHISHKTLLKTFQTSFWAERHWHFALESYLPTFQLKQEILYSTQPYTRRHFVLSDQADFINKEKVPFNYVDRVIIFDMAIPKNSNKYFPVATELAIYDRHSAVVDEHLYENLHLILSLTQITRLIVDDDLIKYKDLLNLLCSLINLHTLKLSSTQSSLDKSLPSQRSKQFRTVSEQNKIVNLMIEGDFSLKTHKFLLNLCPRLQYFSIQSPSEVLLPAMKFLQSKIQKSTSQLISLSITQLSLISIEQLLVHIRSEALFHDSAMIKNHSGLFIWF